MFARRGLVLLAFFAFQAPAHAAAFRDATGVEIKPMGGASRIVTLAPSLGELVSDFLTGEERGIERIVGVSDYTDYPPTLSTKKSIGSYARFNLEQVVALKPDLVFATMDGNAQDQIVRLRELGLAVVTVRTESFDAVGESMRMVGLALGLKERGEAMARQFEAGLEKIRARSATRAQKNAKPRARVLLQVGDQPLIVAGGKSFLNDALDAVGTRNLYADLDQTYPRPGVEDVLKRNPDAILVIALGGDLKPFEAMAARWKEFPSLAAVRSGQVRVLKADPLIRPTLRLLEGLSLLERALDAVSANAQGR